MYTIHCTNRALSHNQIWKHSCSSTVDIHTDYIKIILCGYMYSACSATWLLYGARLKVCECMIATRNSHTIPSIYSYVRPQSPECNVHKQLLSDSCLTGSCNPDFRHTSSSPSQCSWHLVHSWWQDSLQHRWKCFAGQSSGHYEQRHTVVHSSEPL